MDAQFPFASREDIWRLLDEIRELRMGQDDQGERLARLERRREEDARLRNVWGPTPLSPMPIPAGTSFATGKCSRITLYGDIRVTDLAPRQQGPPVQSPPDPFTGFDQSHHAHHGMAGSSVGHDAEEEPRRGASRANSVRFDESAIHGSYGHMGRSSTDLPLRTGSGLGGIALSEPSLSHRSDGPQSSSGQSHHSAHSAHSARTNSLGLDTSRLLDSISCSSSPLATPSAGLFLLGPVPGIIRCWLTTNFTNDALLYAAVCTGSYISTLGAPLIRKLGLEGEVTQEDGKFFIKLPFYFPEASIHQASTRSASPDPRLPFLTVRFLVREIDPADQSIQIVLGSDVLRSHNADILFSQDKVLMVDDERNLLSIPMVRPEKDSAFKHMWTVSDHAHMGDNGTNGHEPMGVINKANPQQSSSAPASARASVGEAGKPAIQRQADGTVEIGNTSTPAAASKASTPSAKPDPAGAWPWRRNSRPEVKPKEPEKRPMKVLRPAKLSNRTNSSTFASTNATADPPDAMPTSPTDSNRNNGSGITRVPSDSSNKTRTSNPVGSGSAFPWLNSGAPASGNKAGPAK
ncbi:hypothetical protein N7532_003668 [Penicillium argentinense]|uniref:Ubiquitin carboxyl-terminal hydrolase 19 n=1 Tax=Penicillium argentinense TaxID=1131581 RepID=A0A9W9KE78_9EURO|nr:uncharacterized protein N7532_003668 [Penicillium argentinense]KAJ5103139.1 hypothetical protein N7532_003668 [Penicillium argentinense]